MFQMSVTLVPIPHPKHRIKKRDRSWKRCTKRIHQNRIVVVM